MAGLGPYIVCKLMENRRAVCVCVCVLVLCSQSFAFDAECVSAHGCHGWGLPWIGCAAVKKEATWGRQVFCASASGDVWLAASG